VNYFGHAAVASWSSAGGAGDALGALVLGAMLPDFESMCGERVAHAGDAGVERGIALHHATDGVFHALPVVTGLMRELDARLAAAACARGPRRAVAHIGVELLLDGVLVREPAYRAAFLAGIACEPAPAITWRDDAAAAAARFAQLIARLRGYGVPDDLQRPEAIAQRVQRILAHRPLLAPSADDLRAIRGALIAFQPRIEVAAEAILRGVRAGLEARAAS
jgi:hypothetical protein